MPSKESIRFAGFASPTGNAAIEALCEKHDVAKSALLEVLVLGAQELNLDFSDAIARGKARRDAVRPDGRKTRAETMRRLAAIPKEQLEAMLQQAESVKP